jgi:hypothetical protein
MSEQQVVLGTERTCQPHERLCTLKEDHFGFLYLWEGTQPGQLDEAALLQFEEDKRSLLSYANLTGDDRVDLNSGYPVVVCVYDEYVDALFGRNPD